jgi:hypothetical protein
MLGGRGPPARDLSAAFTLTERRLVSGKILERCDALDGAVDGMVQRTEECQSVFDLDADVPTCPGPRDGTCLSAQQKVAVGDIFAGAETTTGETIYSSFPFDTGHTVGDAAFWEFISPLILDPGAVGFVFVAPNRTDEPRRRCRYGATNVFVPQAAMTSSAVLTLLAGSG